MTNAANIFCGGNAAISMKLQEQLIALIRQIVEPDAVYCLGTCSTVRHSQNIFQPSSAAAPGLAELIILIVLPEHILRRLQELQDQVEQHLQKLANVTALLLETNSFHTWLQAGHPFAGRIVQAGTLLYNTHQFSPEAFRETAVTPCDLKACFTIGLHRAQEFLAGAQLYQLRREYGLSAFNLHQAVEQSLFTLLKLGTGYHCHIHSISRLMRYCALVTPALHGIFPRQTDQEKELFRLLQAAYVSSRYSPDFKLSFAQLQALHERTLLVIHVLQQEARRMIDGMPAIGQGYAP